MIDLTMMMLFGSFIALGYWLRCAIERFNRPKDKLFLHKRKNVDRGEYLRQRGVFYK